MCMMKVLENYFCCRISRNITFNIIAFKSILIKYGQEPSGKTKVPIVSTILFSSAISV